MLKHLVLTLVLLLTITVSINANVNIYHHIDINTYDVLDVDVATALDVCVVEYVGEQVVYTPASVWWSNSRVSSVDMCVNQVTNINNNNTIANDTVYVVDAIIAIDNDVVEYTYNDSIVNDSVYTTTPVVLHVGLAVATTASDNAHVAEQASVVEHAMYADVYTIDYTYYTVVVPSTASDSVYVDATVCVYACNDACACIVDTYIACCAVEHSNTINPSIWVAVETTNLALPYRGLSVTKKWDVGCNVRAGTQLKLLILKSAIKRYYIYNGLFSISRNTLLEAVY